MSAPFGAYMREHGRVREPVVDTRMATLPSEAPPIAVKYADASLSQAGGAPELMTSHEMMYRGSSSWMVPPSPSRRKRSATMAAEHPWARRAWDPLLVWTT